MIDLEQEYQLDLGFDPEPLLEQVTDAAGDYEGCPYEFLVNVLLVDDQQIHQMNLEHRGIDRATDVLSFPMVEFLQPGEFSQLEKDPSAFDPDSGRLLLGDIVLSLDHAVSQAEEYGHSIKRELAFLTAHSMLHLFGYDHMEAGEAAQMEARQEEILQKLGISRG